ncbi:MAG: GntR family transcriptional regulator [Bacteroidales bacterium]|nr:GntR family transcriptional regulator [Bacteroidales bacterium]MCI2121377.1 GntR family transcriptional regulator [Bacteroidales bacterium]MCI2145504.1 GntR family transcriptional regulator [Bacteroidales bacterium]
MEFNQQNPIYLQIADVLCEKILSEEWVPGDRIPSVREYGAALGVNPNTIMRSYDYLQSMDIFYNKRGIGYFVADNAKFTIQKRQREHFLNKDLPMLIKRMKLLGITIEEFASLWEAV